MNHGCCMTNKILPFLNHKVIKIIRNVKSPDNLISGDFIIMKRIIYPYYLYSYLYGG